MQNRSRDKSHYPLHDISFEKDSCGFGLLISLEGPQRKVIDYSLESLTRLMHRGAIDADGLSGDGCGISISMPMEFMKSVCATIPINFTSSTIVAQVFMSQATNLQVLEEQTFIAHAQNAGLKFLGKRLIPHNVSFCGETAKNYMPVICQFYFEKPNSPNFNETKTCYCIRKKVEHELRIHDDFYICSFSSSLICYKALVLPQHLVDFYPELANPLMASRVCLIHQRFATNTIPRWKLAQPFHHIVHNGEINTLQGNRFWFEARTPNFLNGELSELNDVVPLFNHNDSDSASFDELICLLKAGGLSIVESMRVAIPPSWANQAGIGNRRKSFYEYYSMCMESWDGPASMAFFDNNFAGCITDRNGLRPARWVLTTEKILTVASEIGVRDYAPSEVVAKGKLSAGEMLVADLTQNKILGEQEIFDQLLEKKRPYTQWIKSHVHYIKPDSSSSVLYQPITTSDAYQSLLKAFGVNKEEIESILKPLANAGSEAVGSMGDDTPLPLLSTKQRSLYDYFRQQFAQVTNPPIDSLRENLVMSLETCIGPEPAFFTFDEQHVKKIVIRTPLLSQKRFLELQDTINTLWSCCTISLLAKREITLQAALDEIVNRAITSVSQSNCVIILSDRGIDPEHYSVHALLATGAIHHALCKAGLRTKTSILVETATVRDPHHLAVLIGNGATAVYPYLAYETIFYTFANQDQDKHIALAHNYRKGMNKGLLKILSKMGISTVSSYRSSQLFEIVGLDSGIVNYCFKNTPSRLGGHSFDSLYHEFLAEHKEAFDNSKTLSVGGLLKYVDGGEYHAFNPEVVRTLQVACNTGNVEAYKQYSSLVNHRPPMVLRDLMKIRFDENKKISIDLVEPISSILPRFDSAGMSLGALSPEAHITLAKAMNTIGGRSNSGEGGEDSNRYGTLAESKIKQVASGRFGVTPYYLRNAEVLQIKIAQGAKPGEGGQLPGDKVNPMIAKLRLSMPGVSLISPPPHHDIYSIEDLAQLIFDLKQINPKCLVSVKLVSEAGVGTIATGVAKAYADLITIAGYDGGTGASPLSSVKYAGTPWELGLPETHQLLVANNLRHKVRLQVDGGLKTGLDIIKAAILGAESFGFGTAPMIAMGCKYLRICHLNNCATGIATQHDTLRKLHFHGEMQMVINFFTFVANEVRELMAQLGVRSLPELIGRTDLLTSDPGIHAKHQRITLGAILHKTDNVFYEGNKNNSFDTGELAERMVQDSIEFIRTCATQKMVTKELDYSVKNFNRSIGARVSGEITELYGNAGLGNNTLTFNFTGTAGQSFGAFNTIGMQLHLEGDCNDYVGKGQYGGIISIRPPENSTFKSNETIIAGNTCLYGATGGKLFAAGMVGERFAVRNSGAITVIEGAGNHCCEYMTGGVVVVLGKTGLNFAAGMTGGIAFCLDEHHDFVDKINNELVDIDRITTESKSDYQSLLLLFIEEHYQYTKSSHAKRIIDSFEDMVEKFWLITPKAADLQELLNSLKLAA
ncbi:MAG: glutamate synthase large subunit [Methylacidiphilales bacterium]|nr:glutamate synthase large subunit [Candidatus Methylacidiphilales bacterium]